MSNNDCCGVAQGSFAGREAAGGVGVVSGTADEAPGISGKPHGSRGVEAGLGGGCLDRERRVGLGGSGGLAAGALYSIRVSVLLRSKVAFRASSSSLSLRFINGLIQINVRYDI